MIDIDYYLSKLRENTFSIFLFHGVIEDMNTGIRNYTRKHLPADEFEILIKRLKVKGNPVSMDEISWYRENNNNLPSFSYAITFDDGFENNYSVAAPILENQSTPATFYVSTNLVDKNLMTWIDRVEYCFEKIKEASIQLPWQEEPFKLKDRESKIHCLDNIRDNVKLNYKVHKPEKIVDIIFAQCGEKSIFSTNHPLDQKMSWNQVNELHRNLYFTVGGHSHNHVSLGALESSDLKNEIQTSIKLLKNKGNIDLQHYSYPEGQEIDYSEEVIENLKKKGIRCCPTAIDGVNSSITDLFYLKRIFVV